MTQGTIATVPWADACYLGTVANVPEGKFTSEEDVLGWHREQCQASKTVGATW